jgi:polyisoprenoid-binding protein YceI
MINRNRLFLLIGVIGVGLLAALGYAFLREPAAPSAPIEAIPLDTPAEEAAAATTVPTEAPTATDAPAAPTDAPAAADSAEPAAEPTAEPTDEPAAAAPAGLGLQTYEISQADSRAVFTLGEVLRGNPTTVVGATDQVAGQLRFDAADLSTTEVGIIQVNARAITTDNNFRNRAIQNQILVTGQYEFITFAPSAIDGLPASAAVGDTVDLQITGDLTILNVTQEATFSGSVTLTSEATVEGYLETTITYADYNVAVPSVPAVAGVDPEVLLAIDFVASALP